MRLIDADALKSYIDCGHLRPPTELCFSELDVCNMIDKQPTIEAVQGEWIKRGTKIKCSNCKSAWSTSFDTIIVGMKYCPMCGAKMTKGGDSE